MIDVFLHLVFMSLAPRELCRAQQVCKQWFAVAVRDDLWHALALVWGFAPSVQALNGAAGPAVATKEDDGGRRAMRLFATNARQFCMPKSRFTSRHTHALAISSGACVAGDGAVHRLEWPLRSWLSVFHSDDTRLSNTHKVTWAPVWNSSPYAAPETASAHAVLTKANHTHDDGESCDSCKAASVADESPGAARFREKLRELDGTHAFSTADADAGDVPSLPLLFVPFQRKEVVLAAAWAAAEPSLATPMQGRNRWHLVHAHAHAPDSALVSRGERLPPLIFGERCLVLKLALQHSSLGCDFHTRAHQPMTIVASDICIVTKAGTVIPACNWSDHSPVVAVNGVEIEPGTRLHLPQAVGGGDVLQQKDTPSPHAEGVVLTPGAHTVLRLEFPFSRCGHTLPAIRCEPEALESLSHLFVPVRAGPAAYPGSLDTAIPSVDVILRVDFSLSCAALAGGSSSVSRAALPEAAAAPRFTAADAFALLLQSEHAWLSQFSPARVVHVGATCFADTMPALHASTAALGDAGGGAGGSSRGSARDLESRLWQLYRQLPRGMFAVADVDD